MHVTGRITLNKHPLVNCLHGASMQVLEDRHCLNRHHLAQLRHQGGQGTDDPRAFGDKG